MQGKCGLQEPLGRRATQEVTQELDSAGRNIELQDLHAAESPSGPARVPPNLKNARPQIILTFGRGFRRLNMQAPRSALIRKGHGRKLKYLGHGLGPQGRK